MKPRILIFSVLLCCWACNNIEDASPSDRKTFIRFYETNKSLTGITAEATDGGYILLGSETTAGGVNGLILSTDLNGYENTARRIVIPGFTPRSLKGNGQHIFVTGDRILFDPGSENLFDLTVTSALVYRVSASGDTTSYAATDPAPAAKTDFHGSSVTINANGEVVLLGTYKEAKLTAFERPFITVLSPATFDTVWSKRYDVLERDYINSKAVHPTSDGKIIWATALLREAGDISRTFLAAPVVREGSIFVNNDLYGEATDQKLLANDIQPAALEGSGYGMIGTFSNPTGASANMFFIRIARDGTFVRGSQLFFDGELSASNVAVGETQSSTEDTGDAITSTRDGGFILAGSMLSTPTFGNGGRDIFLVKIDPNGNVLWNKIIGGEGDETVGSIRETADGGLLICGTNSVSGLSSIFLMKTDGNGELKD